jgi:hypothetical protein
MKRPAEKLYRVKVVLTWFMRHTRDAIAMKALSVEAVNAVQPSCQHHITAIEIKRRFRL